MNITLILQINAPAAANLNLAAQLLMGLALVVGMFLARRKLFRAHAICQSLVVLINYFCTLHGSAGGHEMAGVIVVARRPRP